jgi:hypothetical protein
MVVRKVVVIAGLPGFLSTLVLLVSIGARAFVGIGFAGVICVAVPHRLRYV